MAAATVKFSSGLSSSDPASSPVLIIGQVGHLNLLSWDIISCKLKPRVTNELWSGAVSSLNPAPTDSVSLYLNMATVAALPSKVSRHNTNSRAHSITKLMKTHSVGSNECVVIVCERKDLFASGCAVARAFSLYSRKTAGEAPTATPRPARDSEVKVEFVIVDGSSCEPETLSTLDIKALETSCSSIQMAARLVDAPCNEMNTSAFVKEAKSVGADLGIVPTVIEGEELNKRGFGGIYGVGKAAAHPPALVVLSHTPPNSTRSVAWVGKGIVYDTGGLSIKGKTAMPGMKRDCGGAAAILAAFKATVENGFTDTLHAVLCLAENSVGPLATRPDDIHTLYSGKTVEINNTDAEGRLVLADGVAYAAKDLKADVILDMATLTGAQGISTGKYHACHLTNSDSWEEAVSVAGRISGDLSFPAVYSPELQFPEFTSAVADMKNSVADRNNGQPSCAGLFIMANLGFDFPGIWMHVDMAAPAQCGERATGYGVALLASLFGSASKSSLIQATSPGLLETNGYENESSSQGGKNKKMRME